MFTKKTNLYPVKISYGNKVKLSFIEANNIEEVRDILTCTTKKKSFIKYSGIRCDMANCKLDYLPDLDEFTISSSVISFDSEFEVASTKPSKGFFEFLNQLVKACPLTKSLILRL